MRCWCCAERRTGPYARRWRRHASSSARNRWRGRSIRRRLPATRITAAPTFVLTRAGAAPTACADDVCLADHDFAKVTGDVSLDYALEAIARGAPTFAADAEAFSDAVTPPAMKRWLAIMGLVCAAHAWGQAHDEGVAAGRAANPTIRSFVSTPSASSVVPGYTTTPPEIGYYGLPNLAAPVRGTDRAVPHGASRRRALSSHHHRARLGRQPAPADRAHRSLGRRRDRHRQ